MKLTHNFLLLPSEVVSVRDILTKIGRADEEIAKTIATTGISNVRFSPKKMLTEFIFDGLSAINKKYSGVFSEIGAVIVVSQSYDQRIPSISTRIQNRFNIASDAFCMDIMDGCAGYIKALNMAKMLEAETCKKILIIAGDINSFMTKNAEEGTKILFGDGVSVTILEADDNILDVRLFNNGDDNGVISCSGVDNVMHMNGFEVFRFTRNMVPSLIKTYLEDIQKTLTSYDLLALHQASKLVVATICNILGYHNTLNDDFACEKIGNIGAGSVGAWLSNIHNLTRKGALNMLCVGFGSGLSWGLASVIVDAQINEVINV